MEGTEIASLMLSICVFGTLLYSNDSPFTNYFVISRAIRSVLMGIAIAVTTYLIIRFPFGRRSGAYFNPAITVTFLWLRRIHHWDAVCYVSAHFVGAMVGVAIAREIFRLRLSSAPVLYLVTLPGAYGRLPAFIAEFLLSGLLMGVVLYAANHRCLTQLSRFAAQQSPVGRAMIEDRMKGAAQLSSVILIEDHAIYTESEAILQILTHLGAPWSWMALLRIVPRRFRDACYRFIVRHRYQWFGRTEVCQVPSADIKSRFLD
jgi:predicted DCC family thiol-disulfide oxidoreductase YuxK